MDLLFKLSDFHVINLVLHRVTIHTIEFGSWVKIITHFQWFLTTTPFACDAVCRIGEEKKSHSMRIVRGIFANTKCNWTGNITFE